MDGAGWFQIYRRIVMPLSGPVIATVAILTFLPAWNSYLWPLMVVQEESKRPVMIGVQYFQQLAPAWGEIMAYSTIITIPVLVVFLSFQRAFVSSIAASGSYAPGAESASLALRAEGLVKYERLPAGLKSGRSL